MIYTIQNECLTVQVEDLGAQLASIRTPDGAEYLWQGDPAIWARRAPILFPFIGRLREGTYWLNGTPYAISTHGFARDMVFSLVEQGADHIALQITDTPEIRKVYDAVDINVYEANLFHTKMLIKERDLQNYLFNTDVYELPPKTRLEINSSLRREMIEIFSGRNIF